MCCVPTATPYHPSPDEKRRTQTGKEVEKQVESAVVMATHRLPYKATEWYHVTGNARALEGSTRCTESKETSAGETRSHREKPGKKKEFFFCLQWWRERQGDWAAGGGTGRHAKWLLGRYYGNQRGVILADPRGAGNTESCSETEKMEREEEEEGGVWSLRTRRH